MIITHPTLVKSFPCACRKLRMNLLFSCRKKEKVNKTKGLLIFVQQFYLTTNPTAQFWWHHHLNAPGVLNGRTTGMAGSRLKGFRSSPIRCTYRWHKITTSFRKQWWLVSRGRAQCRKKYQQVKWKIAQSYFQHLKNIYMEQIHH